MLTRSARPPSVGLDIATVTAERTDLVLVFQSGDPIALALAKGALESAEIAFVTQGEGLQDLIGLGRFPGGFNVVTGPVKILVDAGDADRARDALTDIESR